MEPGRFSPVGRRHDLTANGRLRNIDTSCSNSPQQFYVGRLITWSPSLGFAVPPSSFRLVLRPDANEAKRPCIPGTRHCPETQPPRTSAKTASLTEGDKRCQFATKFLERRIAADVLQPLAAMLDATIMQRNDLQNLRRGCKFPAASIACVVSLVVANVSAYATCGFVSRRPPIHR
jgi:hypothetical protein